MCPNRTVREEMSQHRTADEMSPNTTLYIFTCVYIHHVWPDLTYQNNLTNLLIYLHLNKDLRKTKNLHFNVDLENMIKMTLKNKGTFWPTWSNTNRWIVQHIETHAYCWYEWSMGSIMNRGFLETYCQRDISSKESIIQGTHRPRKASSKNKLFGYTSDRDKFDIAP